MEKGVVCIIVGKSGVLGVGADFDKGGAAGFSLVQNQRRRAKIAAEMDFVRKHCSDLVMLALDAYECSKLVERLCSVDALSIDFEHVGDDCVKLT